MGFRIGRKFAQHVYPSTGGRGGGAAAALARNFATGPKSDTEITGGGILVPWNGIDVGASPSVNIPITPKSTGIVTISGIITISNSSESSFDIEIDVQVEGSVLPNASFFLVPLAAGETIGIPFLAETTPTDTPVGVTKHVQISVNGDPGDVDLILLVEASAISIQEVSTATG